MMPADSSSLETGGDHRARESVLSALQSYIQVKTFVFIKMVFTEKGHPQLITIFLFV